MTDHQTRGAALATLHRTVFETIDIFATFDDRIKVQPGPDDGPWCLQLGRGSSAIGLQVSATVIGPQTVHVSLTQYDKTGPIHDRSTRRVYEGALIPAQIHSQFGKELAEIYRAWVRSLTKARD